MVMSAIDCTVSAGAERKDKNYELQLQLKTKSNDKTGVTVLSETMGPRPYVIVKVEGCIIEAMIDTGCPVCIIPETVLVQVEMKGSRKNCDMKMPELRLTEYNEDEIAVSGQVGLGGVI